MDIVEFLPEGSGTFSVTSGESFSAALNPLFDNDRDWETKH